MKKTVSVLLLIAMALTVTALSSCGIAEKVENAVVYPDAYSITYEITTEQGLIYTLTKTVDENGSIYFKGIDSEMLFINGNGSYTMYRKGVDGAFTAVENVKYTREAAEKEISLFDEYAKRTTDKFIPTARLVGEMEIAGRKTDVYKIGVNLLAASFYHVYRVDRETGVCLGVSVENTVFGNATKSNEETFVCIEFITENIEDLTNKISK